MHIFQPSQSRSSSTSVRFTLRYFPNCPSLIHFTTCPIHSNLFFLMFAPMSRYVCSFLNCWLILILHIPSCSSGPYILLSIFLCHVLSIFMSISVMARVSLPYTTSYDVRRSSFHCPIFKHYIVWAALRRHCLSDMHAVNLNVPLETAW
jgi:hypothetical protein